MRVGPSFREGPGPTRDQRHAKNTTAAFVFRTGRPTVAVPGLKPQRLCGTSRARCPLGMWAKGPQRS